MTLLSNICNKTNGILSHMRPSIWPARQDSSLKTSSLAQRPPNENDSYCRRQEHNEWRSNVTPRHVAPSSTRRSCPENRVPHSDDPRQPSGRSIDNGRFPAIDDALSFAMKPATSHRSLGSSDSSSSPTRYAELEVALDLFDTARSERTQRYNAVEGMLHFLDAQAELRQSAN